MSAGFLLGLAIALISANSGIKSLFEGMNVAYGEAETRSFVKLNALSLAFTMGGILVGVCLIVSVGIVPAALAVLRLENWTELLISLVRWPLLVLLVGGGMTVLFRYGPSREKAKWRWLSVGAALATLVWLAASWAFSFYLQNFADYNATYGTLGAVIGFMMWTWISVIILLVGAELNAELEHHTSTNSLLVCRSLSAPEEHTWQIRLERVRTSNRSELAESWDGSKPLLRRRADVRYCAANSRSCQSPSVKSFGRREAYESPRGRNPRATVDGYGDFELRPMSALARLPVGSAEVDADRPLRCSIARYWRPGTGPGGRRSASAFAVDARVSVAGGAAAAADAWTLPCRVMANPPGSSQWRAAARVAASIARTPR